MENLTRAIYMAFAMAVFVIAFSITLYLEGKLNATVKSVVYNLNGSYYDSLSLTEIIKDNEDRNKSRIVGIDTIIPTLYRYYKESFAVKILDIDGNLIQYFDTTTESDVDTAIKATDNARDDKQKALLNLYNVEANACYLFGVPWMFDINRGCKSRVDLFISGGVGYINNVKVDYSRDVDGLNLDGKTENQSKKIYLNNFKNRKFKEMYTQYAYEGDTVSSEENGELVTLTGSHQISTKIIIIYQLLPDGEENN